MNSRRRDDRSAPTADHYKQWVPTDKYHDKYDYDADRRRDRSSTLPSYTYDQRTYPAHDTRYHDARQPTRSHRQDPHYTSAAPSSSYHQSSAPVPPTSRTYQQATRPSAQYPSSGYHYSQPTSYQQPTQPMSAHPVSAYPVASSSRRPYPEAVDPRTLRRAAPVPVPQTSYEQVSSNEDIPRSSRHPSRPVPSSTQPPQSAPANQSYWMPAPEMPSRRPKDPPRDRERDRDRDRAREREREKASTDVERDGYRERVRADLHRERERERERAGEAKYQEASRSKHLDKRKDSDTEGVMYSEQRNASKASLSGREGYATSVREPSSHRRHRTEDGTTTTSSGRNQPENTQNPITTLPAQSTSGPPADGQQTGDPLPAPHATLVHLPPKAKSHHSHRERSSTAQGAQSSSDTERSTGKHRTERTPSGPAVQRADGYVSSSTRDRGNNEASSGPRDDLKRLESKYGVLQDTRQPPPPVNVDTPHGASSYHPSYLPTPAPAVSQFVGIRAGQGPSDPQAYDAHFKSSAISHLDAPQDILVQPPHPTSASIIKSPNHIRSHSSEAQAKLDRPVTVEHSRAEPHGVDQPPAHPTSIHESRTLPTPISRTHSYTRGNPETGAENSGSSRPPSRPPSRSAHRASVVPPAVIGPRPLRSVSQGYANEPSIRPLSIAQHPATVSTVPNQHSVHSVPPSPPSIDNSSPTKAEHTRGSPPSTQASPEDAQLYGTSSGRPPSVKRASSGAPSTPVTVPQTPTTSSRPSTRQGTYPDVPNTLQQIVDRPSTMESRSGQRKASDNSTVKAAWIVQTAPATAKNAVMSREEKYLRGPPQSLETPHPELRRVLSEDNDSLPRASSSMMKASQAVTPQTSSQRNSPGAKAGDIAFGTPRGTLSSNSPKSKHSKETPTPEHWARQNLPPHLAGLPQIAIVGATPITQPRDLPQHGRVDHSFLVPAFPAPTRVSRTTSGAREQQPQPAPRNAPPVSYQPPPAPALPPPPVPVVHTPSLFQPYRPPTPPSPEESAQSSPPPLPVPPPRGFEDSDSPPPPPPIKMRTAEIIATRSQNDDEGDNVDDFPLASSEILHKPTQHLVPSQTSPKFPLHTHEMMQSARLENKQVSEAVPSGSSAVPRLEARPTNPAPVQLDTMQAVHPGSVKTVPVPPLQTAATRPRPKVMVEDVTEDSSVTIIAIPASTPSAVPPSMSSVPPSKPTQAPQHPAGSASTFFRSASADQGVSKSSPQSKSKESPLHRPTEPISGPPVAPAMPPPPPVVNTAATARGLSSAPPNQPSFVLPPQPSSHQRSASHTVSSRTLQRATEIMQASKLSATPGGPLPSATATINKSTSAPAPTSTNVAGPTTGQQPSAIGTSAHATSVARLASASAAFAPQVGATTATYATKVASAYPATTTSVPPVSATELGRDAPLPPSMVTPTTTTTTGQHHVVNGAGMQAPPAARLAGASATAASYIGIAPANYATKVASTYPTPTPSNLPISGPTRDAQIPSTGTNTQSLTPAELYKQQVSRAAASQIPSSLDPPSTTLTSSSAVKNPPHEQTVVDSTRLRDGAATRNLPSSSHAYPTSARPGTSPATTQQTHPPPVQSSNHHRVVSLPTTQPISSTPQKPPSPRKASQPIPSTGVSTQPFPPRTVPVPGHLSAPAPPRVTRLPSSDRVNDTDILKTPSSIAPSPMLNADSTGPITQPVAPPMRARQSSTDSKDSKKKPSGLFGLFRTRTLSSKQVDPPVVSTTTKPTLDDARNPIEVPIVTSIIPPTAHKVASTSAPRETRERDVAPPPVAPPPAAPAFFQSHVNRPRVPDPVTIPPPPAAMAQRNATPHIFTPFKFLAMHSKRNRTVSAASLDVCDGNTATNTVVGSPDHSVISQAPPLPPIIPPDVRDPLVATTEWRDREEAERRERRKHRIRRPGVTFDLDEEPPSPPPGAATKKNKNKLSRRPTGRIPGRVGTPGPVRS